MCSVIKWTTLYIKDCLGGNLRQHLILHTHYKNTGETRWIASLTRLEKGAQRLHLLTTEYGLRHRISGWKTVLLWFRETISSHSQLTLNLSHSPEIHPKDRFSHEVALEAGSFLLINAYRNAPDDDDVHRCLWWEANMERSPSCDLHSHATLTQPPWKRG